MRVSLTSIKQYIDFELPPVDELVARINAQLGGVEEVIDLGAKYKDAVVVKVVECEKHPNADKLSSCKIDAGTGELIQVVCGAPNVHAGMWTVWLPPESIVPSTYGTSDEFKLGARELRGIVSNGMLASARELGIGDDHSGIVDVTERDVPAGKTLSVGASFADIFGLNDYVIDIENKMFTHRPDLFGQLGVAREIAGILGKQFTSPDWYLNTSEFTSPSDTLPLEVFNEAPKLAPRFMAVVLKNIEVKESPLWLKCALMAMGGKPINNIVDATNYVMFLTAQPTHAYDYDKIRGQRLGVRMATSGETVPLLNGKTYTLTSEDVVIADSEGAIGLAGIMGGGNSEVSSDTKTIVLEVANFDMYAVRKSSMRHGIFTDALTRFNKGQSPLQNDNVMSILMTSIYDVAGGVQASRVNDLGSFDDCIDVDDIHKTSALGITEDFINNRLGLELSKGEIATLLGNVEFKVSVDDSGLDIYDPFWRTDIDEPEDIVEEVGRLYGYDKLPRELPSRTIKPAVLNVERELSRRLRDTLSRAGANEVLTYSFVHERALSAAGQNTADAYQLSNALSPDLQYYRLSLTPSLLDKMYANTRAGYDEFALFEIGKSHSKTAGLDDEQLPIETPQLALVYACKDDRSGAAFYQAKAFLAFLAQEIGTDFVYEPLGSESTAPVAVPFEPKRAAIVSDKASGRPVGIVGEYKTSTKKNLKLPDYSAGFELDIDALLELTEVAPVRYRPLSRYPSVERDMSLKTEKNVEYATILAGLTQALSSTELDTTIAPVGIYQPEGSTAKHTTFRVTLSSPDRTLTSIEVNDSIDRVAAQLKSTIDAEVI